MLSELDGICTNRFHHIWLCYQSAIMRRSAIRHMALTMAWRRPWCKPATFTFPSAKTSRDWLLINNQLFQADCNLTCHLRVAAAIICSRELNNWWTRSTRLSLMIIHISIFLHGRRIIPSKLASIGAITSTFNKLLLEEIYVIKHGAYLILCQW